MSWRTITHEEFETCQRMRLWIETARKAGYAPDWLPTNADISKSALLERIMSGKPPLEFPPPKGFSCPWYALVEDKGPHFVGNDKLFKSVFFGQEFPATATDTHVLVLQNQYTIVNVFDEPKSFLLRDDRAPETPYRFWLRYDPDYDPISSGAVTTIEKRPERLAAMRGGWLISNAAFGCRDTPMAENDAPTPVAVSADRLADGVLFNCEVAHPDAEHTDYAILLTISGIKTHAGMLAISAWLNETMQTASVDFPHEGFAERTSN